jgi:hypothetical protein
VLAEDGAELVADLADRRARADGLEDVRKQVVRPGRGAADRGEALLRRRLGAPGAEGLQALDLLALLVGVDRQDRRERAALDDVLVDADDAALAALGSPGSDQAGPPRGRG